MSGGDALAIAQLDRRPPLRQRRQRHSQHHQSLLRADVDGMVDDGDPGLTDGCNLPEQTQTDPQGPVDHRGEMRNPACAKQRLGPKQIKDARDATKGNNRLQNQ